MERDVASKSQVLRYYRESIFNRQTLRTIWIVLFYTLVILAPGYLLSFVSHLV